MKMSLKMYLVVLEYMLDKRRTSVWSHCIIQIAWCEQSIWEVVVGA